MCYRATQTSKAYEYADYYKAQINPNIEFDDKPLYQAVGFKHPKLFTVATINGIKQAQKMQWGLMADWKKPMKEMLKISDNTLNAVSETVFELPSFKNSIMTKRCILPVEGFFEFKEVGRDKLPYFIHPKNHPYFNLACIYSHYTNPVNNELITSFSILTAPANELMSDIHNSKFRQPVIISDNQIELWMDDKINRKTVEELMKPCDDSNMAAYRVSNNLIKLGNKPRVTKEVFDAPQISLF